ncbi:MAG: hypothetical protein ACRELY_11340, partial [Polyangiaceae bacterium]
TIDHRPSTLDPRPSTIDHRPRDISPMDPYALTPRESRADFANGDEIAKSLFGSRESCSQKT